VNGWGEVSRLSLYPFSDNGLLDAIALKNWGEWIAIASGEISSSKKPEESFNWLLLTYFEQRIKFN